ncbi:nuclear transport factor 2 family protein [Neolewinella aurantiaca]|uniref:Nuclear transport factor 2 family protein n=1 Tax=Neolewinella aurantiaca TaxID=2602767 RepID=A0A5C7FQE8_9BACT|nr:nuclear transport factor 2 family protein [Neolewinella aurantiaca]TXF87596.1 nuclear transport factor 2 family protein [Neolewinella aurantiaca]
MLSRIFINSCFLMIFISAAACQTPTSVSSGEQSPEKIAQTEKQIRQLSADKWQWMADKQVDKLAELFDDSAKFVHMSGSWNKDRELEIIKTGSIWYKNAEVHDVAVEVSGNTAVLWNRITLEAFVRGSTVSNEFTVTEVYQRKGRDWKMLAFTFSNVRDTHKIEQ